MNNCQEKSVSQLLQEAESVKSEILAKRASSGVLSEDDEAKLRKIEADISSYWFWIGGV